MPYGGRRPQRRIGGSPGRGGRGSARCDRITSPSRRAACIRQAQGANAGQPAATPSGRAPQRGSLGSSRGRMLGKGRRR